MAPRKSGFLFVFAAFADDVGDVVVALFLLFDEGGFFGLLDLEVVVAFDGLKDRAAFWADDRILAEIVEFGAATAAETLRAELGFCHGSEILKNGPDDEEKWCFPWPLARPLSIASAEVPW